MSNFMAAAFISELDYFCIYFLKYYFNFIPTYNCLIPNIPAFITFFMCGYNNGKYNEAFLSMALAYIEIGKVSAEADSELKNTSEYENAIAYQLYHSVELFYKYMLLSKGITQKTHDIEALETEYRKHFLEEQYQLEHPFDFSNYTASDLNPGEAEMAEAHLQKFKPKFMDQHLRYPSNHNTGGYSYKFESCYFDKIKENMLRISAITC